MQNIDFNYDPPVNQLSSVTNSISNPSNSSYGSNRNISNRYYMLANLSPTSSFTIPTDDNSQPHNYNAINLSRNNVTRNSSNPSHSHIESFNDYSPIYNRDNNSEQETSNNNITRILKNYNNDIVDNGECSVKSKENLNNNNQSIKNDDNFACANEVMPFNWQISKLTVRERISTLFNNQMMSDVEFIVGSDLNVRRIPAHQLVLAVSSPVFDAMFFGLLSAKGKEKDSTENINNILEIAVPDIEPLSFLALLKYIYTDQIHINPETVMTTLYCAKKYSIATLEKACVEFLKENLSADNAFMLLTQARLFNETQLANQCLDVIDKNASDSMASEGFLEIDIESLCLVLDRDTLGIRELKLFKSVLRWAQHQVNKLNQNNETTNDSKSSEKNNLELLKEMMKPTIRFIRFPLISPDELATLLLQYCVLDDSEMAQLFLYFHATPRPQIPYKDKPRSCLVGQEQTINRYPVIEQRWGYSGTSDRIRFSVDRKIYLVGYGLYGSIQVPAEYQVLIDLISQENGVQVATNFVQFKSDGTNSIFAVRFTDPVEILPNCNYIACATIKGPDSYYGSIGYQKVIHESATHGKVSFQFYYASGNNNGTSVEDGQIPQFIFYM